MKGQNNYWTPLFQDRPIPAYALDQMQHNIMAQILASPVDFAMEKRMAERRRWGALLVICMLSSTLALGLLFWFQGDVLARLFMDGMQWIWALLPDVWQRELNQWGEALNKLMLTLEGMQVFWQRLSLPVIGGLCLLIFNRYNWEERDGSL